jgi:hypothetical protein
VASLLSSQPLSRGMGLREQASLAHWEAIFLISSKPLKIFRFRLRIQFGKGLENYKKFSF